jgi:hypothetical protein
MPLATPRSSPYLPARRLPWAGPAAAGLIAATALLLLAACGTTAHNTSSASGQAGMGAAAPGHLAPAARAVGGQQPAIASGTSGRRSPGGTARLASASQAIVYTATMTVRVRDVGQSTARAAQIASQAGGYVSQENASLRPGRGASAAASIQLKIPVAAYPAALGELARLGVQTSLHQQTQDIAQQVADTASRVASDEAAITQLRALLSRTGSVGALLTVQDQINAEESDLEAMLAQQRALNHETTYATVSLQLTVPVVARHHRSRHANGPGGFTAGLTSGWKTLVTGLSWLVTALGAILPIAAVCVLAVYVGFRGRRWLHRRARPRGA